MDSQETQPQCSDHCGDGCKCRRATLCQVEGCEADLMAEKRYCVRKRVCSHHMQADEVYKRDAPGQVWRFCFQCGKLEHLERFDGAQRSCRSRLEMRRKPKRSSSSSSGAWGERSSARKSARKSKSSRRRASRSIPVESDAECDAEYYGQQQDQDQRQGQQRQTQQQQREPMQWQCPYSQQSPFAADAAGGDFGTGFSAESFGDACAAVAVPLPQQSSMACMAQGITRTSTAVSANAVAALLADQIPTVQAEPYTAAMALSATPSRACSLQAINEHTRLQAQMASLRQQCAALQAQVDAARRADAATPAGKFPAAGPGYFAGGAAGVSAKGVSAMLPPSVLTTRTPAPALQMQQQQQLALQRFAPGPAYSSAGSVDCGMQGSAMTAVAAPGHMDLVDMVVAQLDDSNAYADAAALEALLHRELRAAARVGNAETLPPERAQHAWAMQMNDVINGYADAITQSAGPSSQSSLSAAPSTAAAAAAAAGFRGRASMLALQPVGRGFGCMAGPAAFVTRAIPDHVLSARLASLQQQLSELQQSAISIQRTLTGVVLENRQ